jgi:hypothetical protein
MQKGGKVGRPPKKKLGRHKKEKLKKELTLEDYKDIQKQKPHWVPLSSLSSPGAISDRITLALEIFEHITIDFKLAFEKACTMNQRGHEVFEKLKTISQSMPAFFRILFFIFAANEKEILKTFADLFNSTFNWKKCEILCDLKNAFTIKDLKDADWIISRRVRQMYLGLLMRRSCCNGLFLSTAVTLCWHKG